MALARIWRLVAIFCIAAVLTAGLAQAREYLDFGGFLGLRTQTQLSVQGQALAALESPHKARRLAERGAVATPPTHAARTGFPITAYESSWNGNGYEAAYNGGDDAVQWKSDDGLSVRMSDDVSLTGGYQFRSAEDTDFGGYNVDYQGHELRLGIKIKLPYD